MLNRAVTALLILVSASCAAAAPGEKADLGREASGNVVFAVERSTYTRGDTVHVRLTNRTDSWVDHNLCFANLTLEQWSGAEWAPIRASLAPASDYTCADIQYQIPPGAQATGYAFLPRTIPLGTYRISAQVHVAGERYRVATKPFTVR